MRNEGGLHGEGSTWESLPDREESVGQAGRDPEGGAGLRLGGVEGTGPQKPGQGLDPATLSSRRLGSPQSPSPAPTSNTPPQSEQGLENRCVCLWSP